MPINLSRLIQWIFIIFLLIVIHHLVTLFYGSTNLSDTKYVFAKSFYSPTHSTFAIKATNKSSPTNLAVVLSLAKTSAHITEFYLLYESWIFLHNFFPLTEKVIIDLIVFCEQPSCHQLPSNCLPLSNKKGPESIGKCFYEELSVEIVEEWKTYLYMTSIAFMLTKEYLQAIVHYQWILRVDQDAILSPGLLYGIIGKHPHQLYEMQFGAVGHGTDFTHSRLRDIAKKLGYKHLGIHNLCSTWLVRPFDSIHLANLTTRIGKHFVQNEFGRHVPGIEDLPDKGEWPKWWRGVISLYAAEIAINDYYYTTLGHQHESHLLDTPSFDGNSIWNSWHIHCLHNAEEFSKFHFRDRLRDFLKQSKDKRIEEMKNKTKTRNVLEEVINEFKIIENNNGKITGKISTRDFVTALAWQKTYAAIGSINLD